MSNSARANSRPRAWIPPTPPTPRSGSSATARPIQDASSEQWGWTSCERLVQDVRLAGRVLRKSPGFTAFAIATLALGLGVNTAIFTMVDHVMLRGLPYPEPQRLVSLWEEQTPQTQDLGNSSGGVFRQPPGVRRTTVSIANLADYRKQSRSFEGIAGFSLHRHEPHRHRHSRTHLGRKGDLQLPAPPARRPGARPHLYSRKTIAKARRWSSSCRMSSGSGGSAPTRGPLALYRAGRPSVPGDRRPARGLRIAHPAGHPRPHRVLCSRPPTPASCWPRMAITISTRSPASSPASPWKRRGRSSTSSPSQMARQYPETNQGLRAAIGPLRDDIVRGVQDSLVALLGASGLIVLITCVNVANLLLVRAIARRHETSVRFALGASRFRIIRQFLAESVIVSAGGCAAGILLGKAILRVLLAMAPASIPRLGSVTMDWQIFAAAALVATVTGIVFGIAPAWQASNTKAADALKTAGRNTGGKPVMRWRAVLTSAEVALSMILLIGAGLLLKSFVTLMGVDLGFQPERVIAMNINLPKDRYKDGVERLRFYQQLEEHVRALPGVQSVAYANRMPMRGGWGGTVNADVAPDTQYDFDRQAVSPGYFTTLGLTLLKGRLLTAEDRSGQPAVVVVSQALARKAFGDVDPIGHRIRNGGSAPWATIVGVVSDMRRDGKSGAVTGQVYIPAAQPELYSVVPLADFAVRAAGNPRELVNAIQREVLTLDKDQPITRVRTLEEIISASVAEKRFQTALLLIFAGLAVGLSMIGVFGVLSYTVSQRTSELGIRIALGAQPAGILRMVLRQAGALIACGAAAGLAGGYALSQLRRQHAVPGQAA